MIIISNKTLIKSIWVSLFLINNISISRAIDQNTPKECVVFSEVGTEYLFESFMGNFKHHGVYTWKSIIYSITYGSRHVFSEIDEKGVWYFEPAQSMKNTYFLRNKYYNDYLFAGSPIGDYYPGSSNREVAAKTPKNLLDESFMWKLQKSEKQNFYYLRNFKYNEILFAKMFERKDKKLRRDVFTRKDFASNGYPEWIIKCKNDEQIFF